MTDQIETDLNDALMSGDPEALKRLAARLRRLEPPDQGLTEFAEVVNEWRSKNRDILNEADWDAMVRVDAQLAASYPDLAPMDRLNLAGNAVRSGQFEDLTVDADRSRAIAEMRRSRQPAVVEKRLRPAPSTVQGGDDDDSSAIRRMRQQRHQPVGE